MKEPGVGWSGWPFVVVLQGMAANRPELLRSRAVVVSVVGKVTQSAWQVWITKANESESPLTCRNDMGDIKTGGGPNFRDEPGGCLFIGQVVSGMKVARAWSGLLCGTWEPVASWWWSASGLWTRGWLPTGEPQTAGTVRGRVPRRSTGTDHPVVAVMPGNSGGAKGMGRPGLFSGQPSSLLLAGGAW
jgi:hypothetical protein